MKNIKLETVFHRRQNSGSETDGEKSVEWIFVFILKDK